MSYLFVILFLLALAGLILGLVRPSLLSKVIGSNGGRKKVWAIFGGATLAFFILTGVTASPSQKVKTESVSNQQTQTTENKEIKKTEVVSPTKAKITQPAKKSIRYEILQRWSIANGGEGKVVLISRDYLNNADMTAVGEKLKNDTKNDRNSFMFVFTDKKAAELRDRVLDDLTGKDTMTEEERDFYDMHYVGQYNKNGNSGFNEFVIYFDGVMGTNSKTIKY